MNNVLQTIKKVLGIANEDSSFDQDLILYTNSAIGILHQLGVSEDIADMIIDQDTSWTELFGETDDLEIVKTYIGFRVKSMFDPPTNSAAIESLNRIIGEFEWRINNMRTINSITVEGGETK